ncbi:hypothetical protein SETIT_3G390800v2 [Setaria italica]|uniref:F-box associated domain-containing protein n=1 Tax=Setaria italica TaxID=4555 RepID=A0A368QNF2_SETIT|nr:hypothetical protein SETIT_3G390800v2 [Setaria italica]
MSLPRLSRQSLHLVLRAGQAKAAETKSKEDSSLLVGKGSLPVPSIYYSPLRSPVSELASDRLKDAFALFGKSKVLCSDAGGFATMYNAESHSFLSVPELNSPKGARYIAISIPHVDSAMFGDKLRGNHTDSLYMMAMVPGELCSFEMLAYYPKSRWRWRPLPPPPFHSDPKYRTPDSIPFALVGGTRILVSSDRATYSFDTVAMEWSKAGDWVLPFLSKLEYDTELKMWFGISTRSPCGELCAVDLSAVALGSCDELPVVQHVGLDVDLPQKYWKLMDAAVVNLGSGRFCIARFFVVVDDHDEYQSHAVVFTGVEVAPSHEEEGVLGMVNHKSECLVTDEIEQVL